jgi:DNA-binding GntR family transcriptional regulator
MNDHIPVDRYVMDTLMRDLVGHDRRPAAYLVYLAILAAGGERPVALSHQQLADRTGLSKRTVQEAVGHLARRALVSVEKRERTEAALLSVLSPWRRLPSP